MTKRSIDLRAYYTLGMPILLGLSLVATVTALGISIYYFLML